MIKYFFIVVISFFLFINLNIYAQDKNESIFKYETNDKPPIGFEDLLNDTNYGYIDIYFINKYLGSFQAEYNQNDITFYSPENIIKILSENITFVNEENILEIISNPLPLNSQYVCQELKECQSFRPKNIGLVFDKRSLSTTFYINYDSVLEEEVNYNKILPNSTSKNSFIQSLDFNFFSDNVSDDNSYSLSGNSIYAHKEHRLRASWIQNQESFFFNQMYYANEINGKTSRLGYINTNTFGYSFTPNLRMLGIEYSTSINTRKDLQTEFSEPLPIFINERAAVKISANGELIYTEYLDAGNQVIDTRSFPSGSYNINIEIIEDNGNNRTIEKFFVKSISIPPKNENLFYFNLGYIENSEKNEIEDDEYNISLFPDIGEDLFLKFGIAQRWNSQSAIYNEFIYQKNDYLYNPTIYYLGNGYEIKYSLLYGNKKSKGLTFDFNIPLYNNNLSIFARYVSENENIFTPNEGFNISGSYNINLEEYGSLSIFGNYEKSKINDFKNKTYTLSYRKNFLRSRTGSLNFNFDISKNNEETFYNIGFTYNFNKNNNWNYRTTPTWRKRNDFNDYNINNSIKYKNNNEKTEFSSNLTANNSKDFKNILLNNVISDQRYGNLNLNINHDYSNKEEKRTSILGSLSTNFGTDGKSYTFGGKRKLESGIIIDLTEYSKEDNFQLYINEIPTDIIKSSKKTFIPLNPYTEYTIYLQSLSKDNFIRVRSKNEIVVSYPGNVETLDWYIDRMQIITGQFFDQYNNRIKSKTVFSDSNKTFTDEFGFFQMEITDIDKNIWVEFKENKCIFDLSNIEREDIIYLEKIICYYDSTKSNIQAENKKDLKYIENKKYKVINID